MNLLDSLRHFVPELILVGAALLILIAEMLHLKKSLAFLALGALIAAEIILLDLFRGGISDYLFNNSIVIDNFSIFFKFIFILATAVTILLSIPYGVRRAEWGMGNAECGIQSVECSIPHSAFRIPHWDYPLWRGEYFAILLLATVGMSLLASANDLLIAYIALETVSISSYILTSFLKGDRKSSEAGLKYIIYGAVASGIMIYGMSLLYGLTGKTNFAELSAAIQSLSESIPSGKGVTPLLFISTMMILVGFGYKIAMVPFHMWCPDVYEGAPTPVTAFLSVAPKAAGFAILIRFFFSLFVTSSDGNFLLTRSDVPWTIVLGFLSALTMTVGNLGALKQTNIKRLLAYSSIAHCGYLLMGVVVLSNAGLSAILLYFVIYLFMNMGAFVVVIAYRDVLHSEDIKDYQGLGWRSPFLAVVLSVFLFSLTGLPPLAGFIGKLYLFAAVVQQEFYWLAVIGALNGALSLYYYARVIKTMFLEGRPESGSEPQPLRVPVYYTYLAALLVIPIFILGVYWIPLSNIAEKSIQILTLIK